MATLETTLLISTAVPVRTANTAQIKPAEGFQEVLDEAALKRESQTPKPEAVPDNSRQNSYIRRQEAKSAPSEDTSSEPRRATETAEGEVSRVPSKEAQPDRISKKSSNLRPRQDQLSEAAVTSGEESAQGQNLPTEAASGAEQSKVTVDQEPVITSESSEPPVPVQAAFEATLLSSWVVPPVVVQTHAPAAGTESSGTVEIAAIEPPQASLAGGATVLAESLMQAEAVTELVPVAEPLLQPSLTQSVPQQPPAPTQATVSSEAPVAAKMLPQEVSPASASALPVNVELEVSSAEAVTPEVAALTQTVPTSENLAQSPLAEKTAFSATSMPIARSSKSEVAQGPEAESEEAHFLAEKQPELAASMPANSENETDAHESLTGDRSRERHSSRLDTAEIGHPLKPAVLPGRESHSIPQDHSAGPAKNDAENVQQPQQLPTSSTDVLPPAAFSLGPQGAVPESANANAAPDLGTSAPPPSADGAAESAQAAAALRSGSNWSQLERAQVISQIVERAHLLAGKHQSEITVVLKPEFLGRINLHATMIENQLVARIVAESASVKLMLESQLGTLQASLQEQGLAVAKVEVLQGNQLNFSDLSSSHHASQQHTEFGRPNLPSSLYAHTESEESIEPEPAEIARHSHPNSRSLNLVA